MGCLKRQRIVIKRGKIQEEKYRCLNQQSNFFQNYITLETCNSCPLFLNNIKRVSDIKSNDLTPEESWKSLLEFCSFRTIQNKLEAYCKRNNKIVTLKDCLECLKKKIAYPSMGRQLNSYQLALQQWIAAGRPERTKEEIENIISSHCAKKVTGKYTCDWYDSKKKRCRGCGCRVATNGMAIFNKVKMATENCPRGKW